MVSAVHGLSTFQCEYARKNASFPPRTAGPALRVDTRRSGRSLARFKRDEVFVHHHGQVLPMG